MLRLILVILSPKPSVPIRHTPTRPEVGLFNTVAGLSRIAPCDAISDFASDNDPNNFIPFLDGTAVTMSAPRLTFLYPHLFRTIRLGEPTAVRRATSSPKSRTRCRYAASITTQTTPRQVNAKRHGKAVEPLPLYFETDTPLSPSPEGAGDVKAAAEDGKAGEAVAQADPGIEEKTAPGSTDNLAELTSELFQMPPPPPDPPQEDKKAQPETDGAEVPPPSTGPMETILHMGPTKDGLQDITGAPMRPPHLVPPPYVHHFDSYSLVKQLEGGGWTDAQAITAMKAVRGLLAVNLDVAQASLVSKSDVENETYLFRAACSELSTEVKKNRRVADEHMRQQRTTLQHEVDILTQSLNQEVLTLNDTVKGMFNDRRMTVREEQKAAESSVCPPFHLSHHHNPTTN